MQAISNVGVAVNLYPVSCGDFARTPVDVIAVLGMEHRECAAGIRRSQDDVHRRFWIYGARGFTLASANGATVFAVSCDGLFWKKRKLLGEHGGCVLILAF